MEVDAKTLSLDIESLTLNELIEFEDATGQAFSEVSGDKLSMKQMRALLWLVLKRDNPELTIEEAGQVDVSSLASATEDGSPAPLGNEAPSAS